MIAKISFWLLVGIVAYAYAGYGVLLWLMVRQKRNRFK